MRVEDIKELVINDILKDVIKEENGQKYIEEADFNNLNLTDLERNFTLNIINELKIEIRATKIQKKDRPSLVRDYDYGQVFTNGLETMDVPVKSTIYNNEDNVVSEDYKELENFLDSEFIPKYVKMIKKTDPITKEEIYEPSIQLNHIVKLKLSELEVKYVFKYLENLKIKVRGTSPDLELDSDIENYDYVRTFKESSNPKYNPNLNDEQRIQQYQHTKDILLRNEIIENNLNLVRFVAYKYSIITGINIHEIESYGYEGLILAIDKFDLSKGYKFSTFAVPYIKGYILSGLPKIQGFYKSKFFYDYVRCKKTVEDYHGETMEQNPKLLDDIFELMVQLGKINEHSYNDFIDLINVTNPEYVGNMDDIESDYNLEVDVLKRLDSDAINELLKTLLPKEEQVIRLRFGFDDGIPKDLEQVAKIFNLSKGRISQIEKVALRKLRYRSRTIRISENLKYR